ncbi:MAG: DNA-binding protein WhiA [Oscillospiraceae bacterium]|jgi:DNA-binding protein WhiA|nr:DNA-binding protein WhiA [Oscillospiraceae bacterium]
MSFSGDIKTEILAARPKGHRAGAAQAYGMLAFGRAFSPDEISLHTENPGIAGRYREYLARYAPAGARIEQREHKAGGREIHIVRLFSGAACRALFVRMTEEAGELMRRLESREETAGFLSGVYLSCGGASDPEKRGYHLEFSVREQPLAETLKEILDTAVPGARMARRRNISVVYYKEAVPVEDLLTLMGASKASLSVVEVEILKEVRNRAMRATNCETANIDKTVRAAASLIEDIRLIERETGLDTLPEPLREAAARRMEYPELSLRELAETFSPPLSRSGLHHRLDRLARLAEKIGAKGGNNNGE